LERIVFNHMNVIFRDLLENINEPNSVLTLGKLTKQAMFELYDQNIKRIDEIDINTIEHKEIKIQVKAAIEQKEQIFKEEVKSFISTIKQPMCS